MALIDYLVKEGWLKTPRIIKAFKEIKREDFLSPESVGEREDKKEIAELDEPLPIGEGQTISQPLVVAFMIEKLSPAPGDKILDIGSGSGYTTALLSRIVGEKGKVVSLEIIPKLKEFGEKNAQKYSKGIAQFICSDGNLGYEKEAPYDGILCSASAEEIPESWKKQLKVGGRIVSSVKKSVWVLKKESENKFSKEEFPGFIFVPLVKK